MLVPKPQENVYEQYILRVIINIIKGSQYKLSRLICFGIQTAIIYNATYCKLKLHLMV